MAGMFELYLPSNARDQATPLGVACRESRKVFIKKVWPKGQNLRYHFCSCLYGEGGLSQCLAGCVAFTYVEGKGVV